MYCQGIDGTSCHLLPVALSFTKVTRFLFNILFFPWNSLLAISLQTQLYHWHAQTTSILVTLCIIRRNNLWVINQRAVKIINCSTAWWSTNSFSVLRVHLWCWRVILSLGAVTSFFFWMNTRVNLHARNARGVHAYRNIRLLGTDSWKSKTPLSAVLMPAQWNLFPALKRSRNVI